MPRLRRATLGLLKRTTSSGLDESRSLPCSPFPCPTTPAIAVLAQFSRHATQRGIVGKDLVAFHCGSDCTSPLNPPSKGDFSVGGVFSRSLLDGAILGYSPFQPPRKIPPSKGGMGDVFPPQRTGYCPSSTNGSSPCLHSLLRCLRRLLERRADLLNRRHVYLLPAQAPTPRPQAAHAGRQAPGPQAHQAQAPDRVSRHRPVPVPPNRNRIMRASLYPPLRGMRADIARANALTGDGAPQSRRVSQRSGEHKRILPAP